MDNNIKSVMLSNGHYIKYKTYSSNVLIEESSNPKLSINSDFISELELLLSKKITNLAFSELRVDKLELIGIKIPVSINSSFITNLNAESNVAKITITQCEFYNLELFCLDTPELYIGESTVNNKCIIDDSDIENLNIFKLFIQNVTYIDCVRGNRFTLAYSSLGKLTTIQDIYYKNSINIEACNFAQVPNIYLDNKLLQFCSRETIRTIKYSFEQQYNKIEANKFHALELSKRREELNDEVKSNFKELNFSKLTQLLPDWLIFSLHGITSNHSQSWVLTIYWIIILSLFGATFEYGNIALSGISYSLLMIPFFALHFAGVFNQKIFKPLVFIIGFSTAFYFYYIFNDFSMANVFRYLENSFQFSRSDLHGFHYVFNKAIIAYLTYQFILGVRKDTRR